MKRVLGRIEERKARFATLDFFRRLEGSGGIEDVTAFAPGLTFFVMAFQDVLRLNAARVRDPELARIVRQHRDEDSGHDLWFLHDLRQLHRDVDVAWLFSPEHETTRDTAYALVAEALRAEHDIARLAIILSLEATGDALFRRVPGFLARAGHKARMLYFSRHHHEVETAHDLHDEGLSRALASTTLAPDTFEIVSSTVERTFDAMEAMVEHLEARIIGERASGTRIKSDVAREGVA